MRAEWWLGIFSAVGRTVRCVLATGFALTAPGLVAADTEGDGIGTSPEQDFAVYALSRGKGVPDKTWEVLQEIEQTLDELQRQRPDMQVLKQRFGLEGETRLCISIRDPEVAYRTFQSIKALGENIDLLNIHSESCVAAGVEAD